MSQETKVIEKHDVVIRFSGDSGDGMQLTGQQFSDTAALFGNDVATFPDYPAEIRAPQGTVGGVSGFQVHIGEEHITTPGDYADVLVAMNPAALKRTYVGLKKQVLLLWISMPLPTNISKGPVILQIRWKTVLWRTIMLFR